VEPPPAEAPAKPSTAKRPPRFREDFPELEGAAAQAESSADDSTGQPKQTPPPPPDQPVLPTDQWAAPRAPIIRQVLLLGAAALAGVLLALAVVGMLASRGCSRADHADGTIASRTAEQPERKPATDDESATGKTETDAPSSTDAQQPPQDADQAPAKFPDGDTGDGSSEPSDDAQKADRSPSGPSKSTDQKDPQSTQSADTPADQSPPNAETKTEKPTGPDQPADAQPADKRAKPPAGEPKMPAKVLDGANESEASDEGGEQPPAKPAAAVDVDKQLDLAVMGIEFDGMELGDFAELIANLTATAVTLDIEPIRAQGLDVETTLTAQLRGATVRQILQAALEPRGLTFITPDNQIVITTPQHVGNKLEQVSLGVADLVDDEQRARRLTSFIMAQIAPATWEAAGGAGSLTETGQALVIRQTPVVLMRIRRLLDRLRNAQGLLPRSELPAEQVAVEPLFVQAATKLAQPISVNFGRPVPVRRILAFLETESDFRILVNWHSLAPWGWTPDSDSTLTGQQQPLAELLERWLRPAGLTFRVLDRQTLQIASLELINRQDEIELYRLPDGAEPSLVDDWTRRIKACVEESELESVDLDSALWYDEVSRCLLVALPQPLQRKFADSLDTKENPDAPLHKPPTSVGEASRP
jgi:hypothetical protein